MATKKKRQNTLDNFIKKSNSAKPKDIHAPKKPLSSYFLFCEDRRSELQATNLNTKSSEISKLLASEWKSMSNDIKSKYNNLANDGRIAYQLQMDEYKQTDHYKEHEKKLSKWQLTQKNLQSAKENDIESKSNDNEMDIYSFTLCHIKGDLFNTPLSSSLCHCISRDMAMGKGIAKIFKQKFGGINQLKQQSKQIGECAILYRDNRFIYYLMTKERYWNKPTYDALKQTLEYMRDHAIKNNVKQISMPRIGCGLDKLIWSKVEQIINNIFNHTNIAITVYSL